MKAVIFVYNEYPVVIFECIEDGEKVWKFAFPGISDREMYHCVKLPTDTVENDKSVSTVMNTVKSVLKELIAAYDIPPVPLTIINILPDEIAKGREIENVINSFVTLVKLDLPN